MSSAQSFAAELVAGMREETQPCGSRYLAADGWTEICGLPGGRADVRCSFGHGGHGRVICPGHARVTHNCVRCFDERGEIVVQQIITEVA